MAAPAKRRSPLIRQPLPQAGQSLEKRLDAAVDDEFLPWFLVVACLFAIAIMAWVFHLSETPPNPWIFTVLALLAVSFATLKFRRLVATVRRVRLGRDGERMVAETLQELVTSGWKVFHDVPADGFNIDHVAIGPGGILAIETKTYSKRVEGGSEIHVSDAGLSIEGRQPSTQIIDQAARQAAWLAEKFQRGTSRRYQVRPVVLFPGWYIRDHRRVRDPWILERKALPAWVAREPQRLSAEQISIAVARLEDYVRDTIERGRH